ncbi:phage tail protein [Gallibacterium salpingitidis]|uniref:Phage tail protein n=2 Tax=Gallibacterium salpingitidis TaxID=505341 RepID=A0AB36E0R4_9PAST|nr:GpE family phage tail protein [Gallibacterium salpingitidis]OBX04268.1 phage tail protein [Gallibacterium salpingitidis]OBX08355.1 phage tail protein [Gallibacterium salpingitidis]
MLADLQWWFKFGLFELDSLTLPELELWLAQAQRQIKAGYQR